MQYNQQNDRGLLNSKEFSLLFLDQDSPSLDIPFEDLILGKKIGSGGFKDCFQGNFHHFDYVHMEPLTHIFHIGVYKGVGF